MRGVELSPTLWGPTVPGQGGSQGWALLSFRPAQDGECPTRPEQGAGTWGDSNTLYQYHGAERRDSAPSTRAAQVLSAPSLASQVIDSQRARCLLLLP